MKQSLIHKSANVNKPPHIYRYVCMHKHAGRSLMLMTSAKIQLELLEHHVAFILVWCMNHCKQD